jgi:hypothetical protein
VKLSLNQFVGKSNEVVVNFRHLDKILYQLEEFVLPKGWSPAILAAAGLLAERSPSSPY